MAHETKIICKVEKPGNSYEAYDIYTNIEYTQEIAIQRKREAFQQGKFLLRKKNATGKVYWRMIDPETENSSNEKTKETPILAELKELYEGIFEPNEHEKIREFIKNSGTLKPRDLIIKNLDWKYLIRSGVRGKNIMITGYQGCGKTKCSQALKSALKRPYHYFNLGATQDPRSTLIGNTHSRAGSTVFIPSRFARAIQIPYAVILLDEVSRAHPEAWNILMTVIDESQRYLALDESEDCEVIYVAEGVTFISTANIGGEFTSTRIMDAAFTDRWIKFEMPLLSKKEEEELLMLHYPDLNPDVIAAIAETCDYTRKEIVKEDASLSKIISTRMSLEWAGLVSDGFTFREGAKVAVYPDFSKDGGIEAERTKIKQVIQKWNDLAATGIDSLDDDDDGDLFNLNEDDL